MHPYVSKTFGDKNTKLPFQAYAIYFAVTCVYFYNFSLYSIDYYVLFGI